MIRVGTCGYSYRDWIDAFYPHGIAPEKMLGHYARHFSAVEIDATYYRVLPEATFASMARRTPSDFRFTAKVPGTGTHIAPGSPQEIHEDVQLFRNNIEPLIVEGKFAAALMQFPNSFKPGEDSERHLHALRACLDDIELVAEFRNCAWQTHETLQLLRKLGIGWVNVDEPQFESLMRPTADVTSSTAYVRFHGRNAQEWWKGTSETRYDYAYTPEELEPWTNRIIDLAASPEVVEVYSFFNNHRRGQAPRNAEMLEAMLAEKVPAAITRRERNSPQQLTFDQI